MNELQTILNNGVDVKLSLGSIGFDLEKLTRAANETAEHYKTLVFTDEQIAEAKKEKASLNKIIAALNSLKSAKKVEFIKPLDEFIKECDTIIKLFKETSNTVDIQVQNFLDKVWETKKIEIGKLEEELRATLEDDRIVIVWASNWSNKTCKLSEIKKDMQEQIKTQLETFKIQDDKIKMEQEKKKVLEDLVETYNNIQKLKYPIKYTEVEQYLDYNFSDINDIIKELAKTRKEREVEFDKPKEVVKEVVEVKKERILKLNLTKSQANLLISFLRDNNIDFEGV